MAKYIDGRTFPCRSNSVAGYLIGENSQRYKGGAPDSLPAIYYLSMARLQQVEPRLATLSAGDRLPACLRLKRSTNQVLSVMEAAKRNPSAEWPRYEERCRRLLYDLGVALHRAGCP